MTDPVPTPPAPVPEDAESKLKALVKSAFAEYVEENKPEDPAPEKTKKPAPSFLESLFGGK